MTFCREVSMILHSFYPFLGLTRGGFALRYMSVLVVCHKTMLFTNTTIFAIKIVTFTFIIHCNEC